MLALLRGQREESSSLWLLLKGGRGKKKTSKKISTWWCRAYSKRFAQGQWLGFRKILWWQNLRRNFAG